MVGEKKGQALQSSLWSFQEACGRLFWEIRWWIKRIFGLIKQGCSYVHMIPTDAKSKCFCASFYLIVEYLVFSSGGIIRKALLDQAKSPFNLASCFPEWPTRCL